RNRFLRYPDERRPAEPPGRGPRHHLGPRRLGVARLVVTGWSWRRLGSGGLLLLLGRWVFLQVLGPALQVALDRSELRVDPGVGRSQRLLWSGTRPVVGLALDVKPPALLLGNDRRARLSRGSSDQTRRRVTRQHRPADRAGV